MYKKKKVARTVSTIKIVENILVKNTAKTEPIKESTQAHESKIVISTCLYSFLSAYIGRNSFSSPVRRIISGFKTASLREMCKYHLLNSYFFATSLLLLFALFTVLPLTIVTLLPLPTI